MILYHYTCRRAGDRIFADGYINPHPQPELGMRPMVWLGDFPVRGKHLMYQLGLTYHHNRPDCLAASDEPCDPVAVRYAVDINITHPHVAPFSVLERDFPHFTAQQRALPGAKPWRWWICTRPIAVRKLHPALGGTRV